MTRRLEIAVAASILLHLAVLAWVGGFEAGRAPPRDTPDTQPAIELRLVEQQGAGEPSTGAPSAAQPRAVPPPGSPAPSGAAPADAVPANAAPDVRRGPDAGMAVPDARAAPTRKPAATAHGSPSAPEPPPSATPPQTSPTQASPTPEPPNQTSPTQEPPAPAAPAPLQMNLGGTDSDSSAVASGPGVIPAALDQRARNRPPIYPEDAARRGQQGTVVLLIHVSPDGMTTGSDVVETSGYESLDRAAQQAVAKWRFRPGLKEGQPVASDMPMRFIFEFQ